MDNQTIPDSSKSLMMILVFILIAIIVIGLGVGVWWFAFRNNNNNANQNTNVAVNVSSAPSLDVSGFKTLAGASNCAQIKNDLFTIDNKMVFWRREGNCPDNAYAYILYARNSTEKLCTKTSTIAGEVSSCVDDSYNAIFTAITANLDQASLGLDTTHSVTKVSF